MKILVVDQDKLVTQLLRSKLEPVGHQIVEEPVKNNAVEKLANDDFDIVMLDPAPLTTPRPLILSMRRSVANYPYILISSETIPRSAAVQAGANDLLSKPIDPEAVFNSIDNAKRLIKVVQNLSDDSEDFPSAGGVIAKSAFNQLFLSAMDRADRYGEQTYILRIALSNHTEIASTDGIYAAEFAVAKLCQYLVLLRRQSDIIGQTGKNEYSLLLQRPEQASEPADAANRFAQQLSQYKDIDASGRVPVEITVSLLDVPSGEMRIEHVFKPGEVDTPAVAQ